MKKLYYLIPIMLVIVGLILPVLYSSSQQKAEQTSQTRLEQGKLKISDSDNSKTSGNQLPNKDLSGDNVQSKAVSSEKDSFNGLPTQNSSSDKQNTVNKAQSNSGNRDKNNTASNSSQKNGVQISILVIGKSGERLYGPAKVIIAEDNSWGVNALGALDATGLEYTISNKFGGDLVDSIMGQRNKGQSGWMYKVNEEIPTVAATKKPVKEGDKIIWWYSNSMDAPVPSWSDFD